MSHADRDWWRDEGASRRAFGWAGTPLSWTLMAILGGAWLVASGASAEIGPGGLGARAWDAAALDSRALLSRGEAWRLVTYGWLHRPDDFVGLAWTLSLLFLFGRGAEREMGWRRALATFVAGSVVAGMASAAAAEVAGTPATVADPSGGTLALAAALSRRDPHAPWWGGVPLWGWAAILAIGRGVNLGLSGGFPWAALVVGAVAGWWVAGAPMGSQVVVREVVAPSGTEVEPPPDDARARLDALLAKIHDQGISALTEEETAFLSRASRWFKGAGGRGGGGTHGA